MTTATSCQWAWAQVVMATVRDAGIRRVITSPGSRSTPLVLAAAEAGLELFSIIDERSAAFFAVGGARVTGLPVALVCTSGSAGAHYFPAIIEASLAHVPVVAITADRPPEHHGAGASQTIDQIRLFGTFARASVDLGPPSSTPGALAGARRRVAQAIATAQAPVPGPVHINVPLRKPLEPPTGDMRRAADDAAAAVLSVPAARATAIRCHADPEAIASLTAACQRSRRGILIAGAAGLGAGRGIDLLAAKTGFPLLCEATSQLRFGPVAPETLRIDAFDLFLSSAAVRASLAPDLILCAGSEPSSTATLAYLAENLATPRIMLSGYGWNDPQNAADLVVRGDPDDAAARCAKALPAACAEAEWRERFARANQRAWQAFESVLGNGVGDGAMPEAAAVRATIAALPTNAVLALGNSLAVRMADRAAPARSTRIDVLSQRGASGIDGLISGAAGAACASGRPTALLVGDVSFAHDCGGLLCARGVRAPLAVVVIDNGGGRIFDELPVARSGLEPDLARHWLTPPNIDLISLAQSVGARTQTARSPSEVAACVARALAEPGLCVIRAVVVPASARELRAAIARILETEQDAP
ncbi:MAG TPA: 2-succinyl-5-enolpyruvyl-6-hydroxy-3-cyclohexene-1-carboxylic-acid synthase [Kofleriaceae bacterium]|nr:2-succinyl-5-enolpyruvyl-6-hydroxy-3-cyclohexene-1-carboxylic-acid synthase [Kofleriaceae bacterium]